MSAAKTKVLPEAVTPKPSDLVRVYWTIRGKSGHGSPVSLAEAQPEIDLQNAMYGAGTHWAEPVFEGET